MKLSTSALSGMHLTLCVCTLLLAACSSGWGPYEGRSGAPLGPQPALQMKSNEFDTAPRLVSGNAAIYPFSASMKNDCGEALVEFTIGEDGKTRDIKVIESSAPYFGGHSAHAVKGWVFEPARRNGKPVAATVRQSFGFSPAGAYRNPETCGPDPAPARSR